MQSFILESHDHEKQITISFISSNINSKLTDPGDIWGPRSLQKLNAEAKISTKIHLHLAVLVS